MHRRFLEGGNLSRETGNMPFMVLRQSETLGPKVILHTCYFAHEAFNVRLVAMSLIRHGRARSSNLVDTCFVL